MRGYGQAVMLFQKQYIACMCGDYGLGIQRVTTSIHLDLIHRMNNIK